MNLHYRCLKNGTDFSIILFKTKVFILPSSKFQQYLKLPDPSFQQLCIQCNSQSSQVSAWREQGLERALTPSHDVLYFSFIPDYSIWPYIVQEWTK
jgi:hypothetical protein